MRCSNCGEPSLPDDAQFCGVCGSRVIAAPEAKPILLTKKKEAPSIPGDVAKVRADGSNTPRRDQRFPLEVEISYESDHNFFNGFTQNISHGGVFIATHSPRPMGAMIDLKFTLPGIHQAIQVVARVKWVREYGAGDVPGMGVEFVSLGDREKRLVEAFIRHREPIFFDI